MSLVPKLRFKKNDGSDFPDWEEKKLGDVCDVRDGTHDSPSYQDQGYILITSKNLLNDGSIDFKNINFISEADFISINKRSQVDIGDILFGMIGTIGNPVQVKKKGFAIKNVALLKEFKNIIYEPHLSNFFLVHYLKSSNIYKQFYLESKGGTQQFIALGSIRKLKIHIPSIQEQEKIAGFLTAVDELIADLTKKESLLQKYKKGVMQKIFSQELRFKQDDGSDYPDWTTTTIKSISTHKSSNISLDSLKNNVGNYNLYGASGLVKKINFFTEFDDYLAIVKDGSGVGRIFYCEKNSSVLGTMSIIKASNQVDLKYLYYVLSNVSFKFCIIGSSIPHIYYKDYSQQKIQNPSLPEQQKIANFLSSIDDQIAIVQKQLDKTKHYKKALLQQLFI